jgi:hypothetical protein
MPSRLTVVVLSLLLATPAVIFWLWLVILPARVVELCPEECWCDYEEFQVDCSNSSLENIPLIFPVNVRELDLDGNNITSFEKDSFISRGLAEMDTLSAGYCKLETIELGAFNGLSDLRMLSVWGNMISEITPGLFKENRYLTFLDLAYNEIEHLKYDVFCGLIFLKYLSLVGNNLQQIHPGMFVGLPSLQKMHLSDNPSLNVPTDRQFINSHSLTHLYISYCDVSLSVETFANVTTLELLDLSNNDIRSVDINILKALPKLTTLYLHVNPLQCDCQLQEVWRWCQDHNIQTAFEGEKPECMKPREVQFMWWGVLEKGQCLEGNISYLGDYKNTSYSPMPVEDTDNENENHYSILREVQIPIYAALLIFGATGNVIIIIIITCNKDMRTGQNMYILNLAISDIIYLITLFSEGCANRMSESLLPGNFTCKFLPFCRRLSVGLSAYSVAVLSIQRYTVIVKSLYVRVPSQPTWRATVATICGVWIVAALFAIPTVLSGHFCYEHMFPLRISYYRHVVIFELLVSCLLPLCVIAFSHIMTARHLVKSARPISEETQNPKLNTRKSTAKIVVGLTVVFLISYVPCHALWSYFISIEDLFPDLERIITNKEYKLQYTYLISTCLLLINSCLNPVALFCTSGVFRRQCKSYLNCSCKVNFALNNFRLRRRN